MKSKHLSMQGMISLLMVIVGNFIYALAVKLFLIPGGLITGGTTGIALAGCLFYCTQRDDFSL